MEIPNLELFYDVMEESIEILYQATKAKYLDLLTMTTKNMIENEVLQDIDDTYITQLNEVYAKLEDYHFNVEEIRKAYQALVLKGFKEENIKNGEATPDTIGILFSYLIQKLLPKPMNLRILDPVVGSGNLLYALANHLDCELELYGIDIEKRVLELAALQGDLLQYRVEMFLQDALAHSMSDMDLVIGDFPAYEVEGYEISYFPYLLVLTHLRSIHEEGYLLGVVPNDFFEHDEDGIFKQELSKVGSVLGIIELPLEMFRGEGKSLIIFHRKLEEKKCLLVQFPSFQQPKEVNKTLLSIESWFENRRKEVKH